VTLLPDKVNVDESAASSHKASPVSVAGTKTGTRTGFLEKKFPEVSVWPHFCAR
jgi:hypothetical protein